MLYIFAAIALVFCVFILCAATRKRHSLRTSQVHARGTRGTAFPIPGASYGTAVRVYLLLYMRVLLYYRVPLRGLVDLKSRGLKRGNAGAPTYMSLSRFAGVVVLLLYCADAFEIQRKYGLESSLVV